MGEENFLIDNNSLMRKIIIFGILGLVIGYLVVIVHDGRILKQKTPVHVTARIHAIYNPAPQAYSSKLGDQVVSGLNVSIVNENEFKNLDKISGALYKRFWFAVWETNGHASEPSIYLVSSSRILRNGSLIPITSLKVGDEVSIDGNFMLSGIIVVDQLVLQ